MTEIWLALAYTASMCMCVKLVLYNGDRIWRVVLWNAVVTSPGGGVCLGVSGHGPRPLKVSCTYSLISSSSRPVPTTFPAFSMTTK